MSTALRLTKLDDNMDPVTNINFEQYEVTVGQILSQQQSSIQYAQTGQPTMQIIGDEYHTIPVTFRNHGESTETKLTELRNFLIAGGVVRVYPKFIAEDSLYFDCFADPKSIPVADTFSGYAKGDGRFTVVFYETDQESQYVVSEEITVE